MCTMNKKKLIIISSVIVAICVIIGCVQYFTNVSKNNDETVLSSEVITEEQTSGEDQSSTDLVAESETEVTNEEKQSEKNNNKNNKDKSANKKTENQNADANDFPQQNNNSAENKPQNNHNNNKPTQKENISVSLTISCKNALKYDVDVPASGYFLNTTTYNVKNGQTVLNVLSKACKENGIRLDYDSNNIYGSVYVQGIGGLYEKQCTKESGWMYTVNGKLVMTSSDNCVLKDGDRVEFYYVTSGSDKP